jgi:hypothetical protein
VRWAVYVTSIREMRNAYSLPIVKPRGKRPFTRCRHRFEETLTFSLWPFKCQFSDAARSLFDINACCRTVLFLSCMKGVQLMGKCPFIH